MKKWSLGRVYSTDLTVEYTRPKPDKGFVW